MKNIKSKNLITVMAMAFMLASFGIASAYSYWTPPVENNQDSNYYYNRNNNYNQNQNQNQGYNYEQNQNYNYSENQSAQKDPAPAKVVSTTQTKTVATKVKVTEPTTKDDVAEVTDKNNDLTALSIAGSDSFMPDTIFEWVLTVIFILIIIILARQFSRRKKIIRQEGSAVHH